MPRLGRNVGFDELSFFNRQLASMARLNLPFPDGLRTLASAGIVIPHRSTVVSEDRYRQIIYQKTASLIECACRIGASFLPDGERYDPVFQSFGRQTGLVFQITDDIFDYLGDPRRLGKPTGCDWEEGRITLPLIAAWRAAPPEDRRELAELATTRIPEERAGSWPQVQAFVDRHGGVEYAYERARGYGEEAKQALASLPDGPQRELLTTAVEYVINRLN